MQTEFVDSFLRPFILIYSTALLFIIDMALIESRFSKRLYYAIATSGLIASCVSLVVLYNIGGMELMQHMGFFVATLPSCLWFYILSKYRDSRFFLAFCIADISGIAMMVLSLSISTYWGGSPLVDLMIRIVLLLLMTVLMVKYVAKPFCHIISTIKKGLGAATFVTLLFYLLLYGYFMFPTTIEKRPEYVPVGILILILLFSCYWFIYKTISWLNDIHLAEKTEQGLRLQLALQKEQYGAIEEKIKADKVFRHDFRHHTKLLAELLGEKKYEEALAYTQKFDNYTLETTVKSYCENVVVNAVLSSHLSTTEVLGIEVTCKAVLPVMLDIDEMELCVVLSNLLENAIENCHSENGVSILDISIKKNKGQLCIRIQNSFDGMAQQDENGAYLSTKPQGGIGLKSVAAIVEKHHGAINIAHTSKVFTVDIAL